MMLVVLGPEIVFQLAMGEWLAAGQWVRKFQESKRADCKHWTRTHSFYANVSSV
jgi:hypothetical protein